MVTPPSVCDRPGRGVPPPMSLHRRMEQGGRHLCSMRRGREKDRGGRGGGGETGGRESVGGGKRKIKIGELLVQGM
jgi:hypothetical protein